MRQPHQYIRRIWQLKRSHWSRDPPCYGWHWPKRCLRYIYLCCPYRLGLWLVVLPLFSPSLLGSSTEMQETAPNHVRDLSVSIQFKYIYHMTRSLATRPIKLSQNGCWMCGWL